MSINFLVGLRIQKCPLSRSLIEKRFIHGRNSTFLAPFGYKKPPFGFRHFSGIFLQIRFHGMSGGVPPHSYPNHQLE